MPDYEIKKDVPPSPAGRHTGLTATLRKMEYMDSIVVPADKLSSIHPCAAQAGAKVRTQKNADGTVTVWRIDSPAALHIQADPAVTETKPTDPDRSSDSIGGHYVDQEWGSN